MTYRFLDELLLWLFFSIKSLYQNMALTGIYNLNEPLWQRGLLRERRDLSAGCLTECARKLGSSSTERCFSIHQENGTRLILPHIQFTQSYMFPLTAIAGISHHISIRREGVIGEGQALGDAAPRHLPSETHSVLPVTGSSSLLCEVCSWWLLNTATRRSYQDNTLLCLKGE